MFAGYRNQIPRWRMMGLGMNPVGFFPTDIAGLQLWLDFSDMITLFTDAAKTIPVSSDGDVIGAAEDKSGNGNDGDQVVNADKPTYQTEEQNGRSIGRFDGISDFLSLSGMSVASGDFTFFVVYKPTAAVGDYLCDTQIGRLIVTPHAIGDFPGYFDGAWKGIGALSNNWQIFIWRFSGVAAELFRDGISLGTNTYVAKAIGGNIALCAFNTGVANWLQADVGEFGIYNVALSDGEIGQLTAYLNKWAIF